MVCGDQSCDHLARDAATKTPPLNAWQLAILEMAGASDLLDEADSLHIVEQSNGYEPLVIAHFESEVWMLQRFADPITMSDLSAAVLAEEMTRMRGATTSKSYRSIILSLNYKGSQEGNAGDWVLNVGRKTSDKTLKGSRNLEELAGDLMHGLLE